MRTPFMRLAWVAGGVVACVLGGGCAQRLGAEQDRAIAAAPSVIEEQRVPLERRRWEVPSTSTLPARHRDDFVRTALRLDAGASSASWTRVAAPGEEKAAGGGGDLSAAAQNPIASNISLPFENNFQFGAGEDEETSWILNIQPVIPIRIGKVNLINRPIIPLMYVPGVVTGLPENGGVAEGTGDQFGLGDINITTFVSPADSKGFTWGVGPSLTMPSATNSLLGAGKWSIGPSFVGLTIRKPWLAGILVRQIWSFAGEDDRADVDQMVIQPFVNYNLEDGWYLVTAPIFVANWNVEASKRWVAPVGAGVGRVFKIGKQPINVNLHAYYNVERPIDAPDWSIRFAVQLIFPK